MSVPTLKGNFLKRYQSYKGDTISILKITKGNYSAKTVGGATVVNPLVMLYICAKFCEIISNSIEVIERTRFLYLKITKGNNSAKHVGGVTVVNLCTLSGNGLYLY